MRATRVTSDEFRSAFDRLSATARDEPVIITEGGEDALVVLSAGEWERLSRRDRRAGRAEDLPAGWLDAVERACVPAEHDHLNAELD